MKGVEAEVLIHSCDPDPDPEKTRSLLFHKLDEAALVDMANREGLAGFLYRGLLKSASLDVLEPKVRAKLADAYYRTVSFNLRLMQDLKEVLCEVNQAEIRIVLLQGMDLLNSVYDDLGLRPLTDVDLWVWREDYPAMVGVLGRLGYERDGIYPTTFKKGATTIDLHAHVLWADRIRTRKNLLSTDEAEILARARSIKVEGEGALLLDPSDQFLYLGLHLLKHRASRLIWLVDLKTLAGKWEEPEWEALLKRAKDLGQERTLAYLFYLLGQVLRFPAPQYGDTLPRLRILEKWVLQPRTRGKALAPWGPAFLYASATGPIRGIPMLFESLFPRTEVLKQMFPDSRHLGRLRLCLKRTAQLAVMATRQNERRISRRER